MSDQLEVQLLRYIDSNPSPCDTNDFASKHAISRDVAVGIVKKLEIRGMIRTSLLQQQEVALSEEGSAYALRLGASSEKLVLDTVAKVGRIAKKDLIKAIQEQFSIDASLATGIDKGGFAEAKKMKWIDIEKGDLVAKVDPSSIVDNTYTLLQSAHNGTLTDNDAIQRLKKRNLLEVKTVKYFGLEKGDEFALEVKTSGATDLTLENLRNGSWKDGSFKGYNYEARGKPIERGHFHALLKVRTEFRKIFLELGFQEMTTNRFVENSFWNFDALFQPQQHPARDAHDTFFTSEPKNCLTLPDEYLQRVKKVHEEGGYGSIGYRYQWSLDVSKTNLLRTHTTAVSSRLLYEVSEEYKKTGVFTPRKYFSIDRVFRNETTDETHLCEFHQIEGMVIDRGLSLGDMIGLFSQFFAKIGITDLRFKPAYNPYTEPSMEIFGFHPQLGKWTEIGNSGMFRPEMLEPMGLPSDVVVLAWGLSLERPTMILYGIKHIQDLMGHTVEVSMTRQNPICRLDKKH